VFWIATGLFAIAAVCAILSGRDLIYDGCYYLLGAAARNGFQLIEPARGVSQSLQQLFAVAGLRLGVRDLRTLGVLYSLGCSGWPVLLTALCWFVLPRGQKVWSAGPLFNLVFVIPATSLIGVGEGIIGSCLLWLAFLLIEFRSGTVTGAIACVVATAACTLSHEAAVLCVLVIAMAAALRISTAKGFGRAALFVTVGVALAGAVNMARWIIWPRSAVERGDYFVSLLGGFFGTPSAPNIPAAMSVLAVLCCAVAFRMARVSRDETRARALRAWEPVIVAMAIFAVLVAVLFGAGDRLVAPSRFFAARGLPVALTTLLAALFLVAKRRGLTPGAFATPPVLAIVLGLALGQATAQLAITQQWSGFAGALRGLVRSEAGVISHAEAMRQVDPEGARFRRELLEVWSIEPLSLFLAPQGHVRAFVVAAPKARWVPYDPRNPATLPQAPELDYRSFAPQ
jgi:hypothetical protein